MVDNGVAGSGTAGDAWIAAFGQNSLRTLLTAGTILVCLVLCTTFLVDGTRDREVAVTAAGRAAANLADSLAQQVSDTLEATNCALFGLAERVTGGPAPGDSLSQWMAMQVMMVPRLHQLLVIDERGNVRANSDAKSADLDLSRLHDLLSHHRRDADTGMYLSGPARNGKATPWLIFASRRIDRADGRFAGVVVAELEVDYFKRLYEHVDVGPHGTIALVSDGGTIMVRKPFAFVGSTFRDHRARTSRSNSTGLILTTSPFDGIARLDAFQRLTDYPFTVWVSVAQDDFLAQWRSAAQANGIAVTLMVTMIGLLSVGLGTQIAKRKKAEESLSRLALFDGLTSVANRRRFDSTLEAEAKRAHRDGSTLALLMIDVDNFKAYNDNYGHPGGDAILTTIAQTIAANVLRPNDLTARYGGEEFAVILPATSAAHAVVIAERIRTGVVNLNMPHVGTPALVVTVSIGVAALAPRTSNESAALIREADAALYESKSAGRNRWSLGPRGALVI
jgi:diguanylate cyclase (GGDEF)-like protein